MQTKIGQKRILTHPETGERLAYSVILDEIYASPEPYHAGDWGEYIFGAWLERDCIDSKKLYVSFPYWRKATSGRSFRFAGQYTLRADPAVVRHLVEGMHSRGWLDGSRSLSMETSSDCVPHPPAASVDLADNVTFEMTAKFHAAVTSHFENLAKHDPSAVLTRVVTALGDAVQLRADYRGCKRWANFGRNKPHPYVLC